MVPMMGPCYNRGFHCIRVYGKPVSPDHSHFSSVSSPIKDSDGVHLLAESNAMNKNIELTDKARCCTICRLEFKRR